ncbi:MAG: flagellar biosynthesis repressor FlbT [Pseudomonadota bacterium]
MPGLMLKMPSGDRIAINGAVIENAGRGARLRVLTPDTQLLRLRDAIDPTDAQTPVGRLAYAVQMIVVGEHDVEAALPAALSSTAQLRQAFVAPADRSMVEQIGGLLEERHFYQALRLLGQLRDREAALLGRLQS